MRDMTYTVRHGQIYWNVVQWKVHKKMRHKNFSKVYEHIFEVVDSRIHIDYHLEMVSEIMSAHARNTTIKALKEAWKLL